MKQYKILVVETESFYDEWEGAEVTQKVYEYDTFQELSQKWKDELPEFEQTQYNNAVAYVINNLKNNKTDALPKGYSLVKNSDLKVLQTKEPLDLESNIVMKHPRNYYYYWKEMTQIFATLTEQQIKDEIKDSKFYIEVSVESMRKAFPKIDEKFKELEMKAKEREEKKSKALEAKKQKEIEKAKALLKEVGELK